MALAEKLRIGGLAPSPFLTDSFRGMMNHSTPAIDKSTHDAPAKASVRRKSDINRRQAWVWLSVVLLAGLGLRLAILSTTGETVLRIIDEKHYVDLATNLSKGNGFGFGSGAEYEPTSIRPPLYPALIAALWDVTGDRDLQAVRFTQILLSLATCVLVYMLGTRMFSRRAGVIAAAVLCFYPTYIAYSFFILAEVLYFFLTLGLVVGFSSLIVRSGRETPNWKPALFAFGIGATLALSALVRSISWPFIVFLVPLCMYCLRDTIARRAWITACAVFGYALFLAPWAVRNSTLQQVPVLVDTMGGMNLCMGNYKHTPEERAWDAVRWKDEPRAWNWELQQSDPSEVHWTEGQREAWGKKHAIEFMKANPVVTARRSAKKFAALWGLEREVIAAWTQGLYNPPKWFAYAGSAAILVSYVALMFFATLGLTLCRSRDQNAHRIILATFLLVCGVHTIVFGHSRYHLPLVPFLAIYGAAAWQARSWTILRAGGRRAILPVVILLALVGIWARAPPGT